MRFCSHKKRESPFSSRNTSLSAFSSCCKTANKNKNKDKSKKKESKKKPYHSGIWPEAEMVKMLLFYHSPSIPYLYYYKNILLLLYGVIKKVKYEHYVPGIKRIQRSLETLQTVQCSKKLFFISCFKYS